MTREIDLVDIGGGNIGSVRRCLNRLEVPFRAVGADNPPDGSRPLILPGVGAFGAVMNHLRDIGLDDVVRKLVKGGTPYLGICIGMQILFDSSEESEGIPGLGLIPGTVVRFKSPKVPQIGWNFIESDNGASSSWPSGYVYFVNSYFPKPDEERAILYKSNYAGPFCAAVQTGNITAFQFHPEKSGEFGEVLLKRWLESVS